MGETSYFVKPVRSTTSRSMSLARSHSARRPRTLCAAALWLAPVIGISQATAAVRLEINGLPDELEDNIRAVVGTLPADDPRAVRRFARDLEVEARTALSALGYYAADIEISTSDVIARGGATDSNPDGRDAVITVDARANNPVLVNIVNLQITGPAREDRQFMAVIPDIPLNKGEIFLSSDYEDLKSLIVDRAQDLGYFDLEFPVARVRVSRNALTADIDLEVQSGNRYTFGDVLFDQNAFSEEFLLRWLTFEPGDQYDVDKVGLLTENLRNSGYFNSVRVIPQREVGEDGAVPVEVTMDRKDDNLIGIGLGFATDVGPRVSLSWEKPLINRYGHSAAVDLQVSEPRQSIGFSYRIPRNNEPLTNFWGFEFGFLNEDEGDTASLLSTVNLQRVTRTTHGFTQSLFLRWEHERSTIGDDDNTTDLVLPGVSYSRSRSKGAPFTTWGQSESFSIFGGTEGLLSSIDFLKATIDFRYVRSFFEKSSFIGAVGLGWIDSNDFDQVPVSQRFFAGGDRSVRGFQYRDISPVNADGDAVGGRFLEQFTFEYNYRFFDRWRAATFIDAGRAFNDYDTGYSVGAGVGVRWESPVGPFRFDVATPISDNDGDGVRVHISVGPDL